MPTEFYTLPEELLTAAGEAVKTLRERGFTVSVEEPSVEFPTTPTIIARRQPQTHYVFIREKFERDNVEAWVSYCKSCTADVRICLFFPKSDALSVKELSYCTKWGVGVYVLEQGRFECLVQEVDLAFQAELPNRRSLNANTRRLLGPAYDQFGRGEWREGFESAARVLEEECRRYLSKQVNAGRNSFKSGSKIKALTRMEIRGMTLGGLKDVFCNFLSQNSLESKLCAGLTRLNPLRIDRIHRPSSRATENRMRARVGRDMWLIVNLVKEINS